MFDVQMECFLNLSETLNFSETAKQLYISQQAVSKNISRLEDNLGFPLFERSPHNVQLTTWGEEYQKLCQEYLKGQALIKESFQKSDYTIKILSLEQPDFEPLRKMPPFVIPGTDRTAKIELLYDTPAVFSDKLIRNDVDMVVTIDRFMESHSNFSSIPLFDLECAILVSRKHPLYKEDVHYSAFKDENFIAGVNSSNFFETRDSIMRDINSFNLSPKSIMIVNSSSKALDEAKNCKGIILGSVIGNAEYEEELATIPTGVVNKIVCIWNNNHCKSYSEALAKHIRHSFQMAANDND